MSRFNAFEERWLKSFAADIPKTLLEIADGGGAG